MARTESTMLELGTTAPDFSLLEPATERMVSLSDFAEAKALLVIFMCNHCPYVIHIRDQLVAMIKEFQPQGLQAVAINANDVENYPDDSPEKMVEEMKRGGYNFPYLYDETQEVAKTYMAACTPDFFLFDDSQKLVYRGQFDAARPKNDTPVTGDDMREAIQATLSNAEQPTDQIPSMGCNIKWKVGNEPDYFG